MLILLCVCLKYTLCVNWGTLDLKLKTEKNEAKVQAVLLNWWHEIPTLLRNTDLNVIKAKSQHCSGYLRESRATNRHGSQEKKQMNEVPSLFLGPRH